MNLSTLLVLVFLVGMWVALLAGPVLQSRGSGGTRGGDSIKSFQRQLSMLERRSPDRSSMVRPLASAPSVRRVGERPSVGANRVPGGHRARLAAQRRRRIVTGLSGLTFTMIVLAFAKGGLFIPLFFVFGGLLVAYVALMFHLLRSQAEREMKVAFLPHRNSGAEPTALLELREAAFGRR